MVVISLGVHALKPGTSVISAPSAHPQQVQEFSDKMKEWAPKQMHKWGFRHTPEYIRDREVTRNMSPDEEVSAGAVMESCILVFRRWYGD